MASIATQLKALLPTARPRVIELALEAMVLHSEKNNDYDGGDDFADLGLLGRFCDIVRKVKRLYSLIVKGNKAMTNETKRDTGLDLAVYALLTTESIEIDSRRAIGQSRAPVGRSARKTRHGTRRND